MGHPTGLNLEISTHIAVLQYAPKTPMRANIISFVPMSFRL